MNPLEFVYKRVDELELELDVYLPVEATREKSAPVCIWWHGGGRKSTLSLRRSRADNRSIPGRSISTVYTVMTDRSTGN